MYIKTLSIQNYRSFGEPAFVLPLRQFTLILGENNIGKTNLLNALCLLFGGEISVAQSRMLQLDDFNYKSVTRFRKQVADSSVPAKDVRFPEIVVDAILTDMNEDQEAVVGDWFINTDLTDAQITYRYSVRSTFDGGKWVESQRELLRAIEEATTNGFAGDSSPKADLWKRVEFPIGEYRYVVYGGGRPSIECDAHFLRMLKLELLDALRDAQRELIATSEQRLLYRILRQGHDSRYVDLKERLLELEECVRQNAALKEIKKDVAQLLERVSLATVDGDNTVDFLFSSPDAAEIIKKIGMVYGSSPVNVERNGLGRNNLLYISLVLSQLAKPNSVATVFTGDSPTFFRVVGIEEPEAHLHPHLQDHLGRNIEAVRDDHDDAMQLLLTSHSTHIAAKLNLENTVVLFTDSSTGELKSHYILDGIDTSKESDSIRFLSLYLDATKSRMLFARKLMLVEGIAEQTLIPRFFELHNGASLERHGATIINVNGVAFSHFLKVVRNGYFLKCVVLTDRDTGTKTEMRADALKNKFDDGKLIFVEISDESTFEKDLIAVNRFGPGKSVIIDAVKKTRPNLGNTLEKKAAGSDLDIEECFAAIENCKAEFAFNLAESLEESQIKLGLPSYIQRAFEILE